MLFTALHRLLGRGPGPIDDELIEAAVAAALLETDDLDWKAELPPQKGLPQTDFPKDVAAMANRGGGVIVYGVNETEKRATSRVDVGPVTEGYERTLRAAAWNSITPPVYGLGVFTVGEEGRRALAVVIPESVDGPHLIYKGEYFGAPIRNDADTAWMKEREIESMYRARFDERRQSNEALNSLYEEARVNWVPGDRAWLVAVAHPRLPLTPPTRPTRSDARSLLLDAVRPAMELAVNHDTHPLFNVERNALRPGLRRWVAVNTSTGRSSWRAAWIAVHHDGSVSLASAVGGHRMASGDELNLNEIDSVAIECAIADLLGIVRATSEMGGVSEYEVRVGIETNVSSPMNIVTLDNQGFAYRDQSVPFLSYTPISATIVADADWKDFRGQAYALAQDCVNQGGVTNLRLIDAPVEGI